VLPAAPARETATDALELPMDIEGLDVRAGLRRLLGKTSTYVSLLQQFVKKHKTAADEIGSALDGDWADAERLAHTVKGVAGTLGARVLQDAATELERTIRERQTRALVEQRLKEFARELAALISQLETKLPLRKVDGAPVAVDAAKLEALTGELAVLLAQDNFAASDLFAANAELLRSAFPEAFGRLAEQIEDFDFTAAWTTLESACQSRLAEGDSGIPSQDG